MDCGGTTPLWLHGGHEEDATTHRSVKPKRELVARLTAGAV